MYRQFREIDEMETQRPEDRVEIIIPVSAKEQIEQLLGIIWGAARRYACIPLDADLRPLTGPDDDPKRVTYWLMSIQPNSLATAVRLKRELAAELNRTCTVRTHLKREQQ